MSLFLSSLFLSLFLSLSPLLLVSGQSTCTPSSTSICVEQVVTNNNNNGFGVYVLNGGVSNHSTIHSFTPHPPLSLLAGTTYTFQLTSTGNFVLHPFSLTVDSSGACGACTPAPPGVNGASQSSVAGAVLTWTPPSSSIGSTYYYQCGNHLGLGNSIGIVDPTQYAVDGYTEEANSTEETSSSGVASSTGAISSTGVINSTGAISSTGTSSSTIISSSTGVGVGTSVGPGGGQAGTGANGAVTAAAGGWAVVLVVLAATVGTMAAK